MFVNDLFKKTTINEGGIDIPEIPRAPMPRPPKEKGVEESSAQDRLHRRHQELRKKSGLPDPEYYRELKASYDIENDSERLARQAEIKKKYRVAETVLNPKDPQGDYDAKRKVIHDLSLDPNVNQQAVQQRRLDLDREAKSKGLKEQGVAEGMDDTVKFEVDSENAYNHIMDKFGSVVEWDGDIMVAPRRYWGAIQELAYAAGGEASEEQGVAEGVEQYLEEMRRAGYDIVTEAATSCPECGGTAYADQMLAEKQDACYSKVKSRYKVWPSAYASGALVRCRKVGAKNWGNKSKK